VAHPGDGPTDVQITFGQNPFNIHSEGSVHGVVCLAPYRISMGYDKTPR
jgi:hypothetical protein